MNENQRIIQELEDTLALQENNLNKLQGINQSLNLFLLDAKVFVLGMRVDRLLENLKRS